MELTSFSASSINSFRQCPRQWKYNIDGLPGIVVPEEAAIYGRAIHNILALYFTRVRNKPPIQSIEIFIEKAFEDGYSFIMKGHTQKTNEIKKNFLEFELRRWREWKQYKPTFVEKRFKTQVFPDLPPFTGTVDFYAQGDGVVIDWKTGNLEMNDYTMVQGKVYELALGSLGYPVRKVSFFALRDGRLLEVPRITKGWLYQICKNMYEQAKNNRFPPKPTALCGWCPHQIRCAYDGMCIWMLA